MNALCMLSFISIQASLISCWHDTLHSFTIATLSCFVLGPLCQAQQSTTVVIAYLGIQITHGLPDIAHAKVGVQHKLQAARCLEEIEFVLAGGVAAKLIFPVRVKQEHTHITC